MGGIWPATPSQDKFPHLEHTRDGPGSSVTQKPGEHSGGSGQFFPHRCFACHADRESKPTTQPTSGQIPKSLRNDYFGHGRFNAPWPHQTFNPQGTSLGIQARRLLSCVFWPGSLGRAGLRLQPRRREREELTPEVSYCYRAQKDLVLLLSSCLRLNHGYYHSVKNITLTVYKTEPRQTRLSHSHAPFPPSG